MIIVGECKQRKPRGRCSGVARGETRVGEAQRFSWCVTPAGHLSRVSLHPTFTDTMSLRSVLRPSSAPFHSHPSRNRGGFLEDARNGLSFRHGTDSPPRHLHRSRLIFLLDRSFAVRAVVSRDPLSPLCRHNRNQLEFVKTVRHVEWHHVELDDYQRSLSIHVRIVLLQYCFCLFYWYYLAEKNKNMNSQEERELRYIMKKR